MRKNRDYKPEPIEMDHIQEVLHLLSVMTNDHRYEDAYNGETKGGPSNMCEVLDRIIREGRAEGRAEGAIENSAKLLLKYMSKHACSAEEAMDELDIEPEDRPAIRPLLV